MVGAIRAFLFATMAAVAAAIYPEDHWNYSTQLTESNFESFIQEQIDQDKTTFAPAWNAVVQNFAANNDVTFGDVNLSEQPSLRGPPNNPGKGGWPTIRYFNKETGVSGGTYKNKTNKSICDELGNDEMMTAYVEEYAGTSLCTVVDYVDGTGAGAGTGCSEKEKAYIEKNSSKSSEELEKEYTRLEGMDTDSLKKELGDWVMKRKKILKGLLLARNDEL